MVWPFIVHKYIEFFAGVFATKTAEINIFSLRTLSKLTILYRIIYSAALTAIAVCRTTRTAIKTARAILRLLHCVSPIMRCVPIIPLEKLLLFSCNIKPLSFSNN